jgi:hypothetical protein
MNHDRDAVITALLLDRDGTVAEATSSNRASAATVLAANGCSIMPGATSMPSWLWRIFSMRSAQPGTSSATAGHLGVAPGLLLSSATRQIVKTPRL